MAKVDPLTQQLHSASLLVNNLHQLLKEFKITEAELSRQTGIPQPTLHKIFTGKTEDPRSSTLKILADFFSISIDQLLTTPLSKHINASRQKTMQAVPIIPWDKCNDEHFINSLSSLPWNDWILTESDIKQCICPTK